eukprot:CAMPEP_0181117224 /NCGR_PEP_ID=MMETSP1071-20121207/22392_1 /TAXON_ID=35127 /ORGANISM="Thalassiosira sp., Strain NH16" /LENGTH=83 /DNA_ID=CAMNT_0023201565 /DNA_START=414 /DNA_END=665 /DNA_ORIENTATION=+
MDIILPGTRPHQMKEFAKVQRIIPPDLDGPRDEDDNGIGIRGRLDVGRLDGVLYGPHGFELCDDGGRSLDLLSLEGQHGLIIE